MTAALVQMENISKSYGQVRALEKSSCPSDGRLST